VRYSTGKNSGSVASGRTVPTRPLVFGFDQQAKKGSASRLAFFLCVEMSMPKGPFLPSDFLPTKFSTAADKADFGNTLLHFIDSEWKETLFIKTFYNQLSNTFGHIAHLCGVRDYVES
jgi:hypothetical protein